MSNSQLSPAAVDALRAATITPTSVILNTGQLDRTVYEEVNKALARIGGGGKWNRRQRAHLFPYDPSDELNALLADGRMPADQDKQLSFFRTPDELAELMVDSAFIANEHRVLEPSAGDGQIVRAIYRCHPAADVTCIEIDERRVMSLRAAGFRVNHVTFEQFAAETIARFDRILMNPPFTVPGNALAWLTHVELAIDLLRPGGRLVALVPGGFLFQSGTRFERLRALVGDNYTELSRDTFKESGTTVSTVMIEIVAPGVVASVAAAQPALFDGR
jgi:predicted RNA methylase